MTDGTQWLEMKECPVCGKRFPVLYPHLWRYKRQQGPIRKYFCSWKCVRKFDQRGVEKMELSEKAKKALKIALEGGNPIEFMKAEGSKNPSAAWYNIKMQAKEKDPETYAKLPARIVTAEQVKQTITEDPEKINVRMGENGIGFKIAQVRSLETEYRYEWDPECGLFTVWAKGDVMRLDLEDMRKLVRELPKAAAVMGVEL